MIPPDANADSPNEVSASALATDDVEKLIREYRPSMDLEVLHSWATEAASTLSRLRGERDEARTGLNALHDLINMAEGNPWQAFKTSEAARLKAEAERDEALDDRDDYRDRLHDLVMIDSEEWAIGGGPGFKARKEKAWSSARERFEP